MMLNFIKSKFVKNNIIEFYTKKELIDLIEHPRPSIKFMPDWFKILPKDIRAKNGGDRRDHFGDYEKTAKSCPPLLDAFSIGITIPFPTDIHVKTNNDLTSITVYEPFKETFNLVEHHPEFQLGGIENFKNILPKHVKYAKVLKFINPWIVKTAPGWSTMFVHPINNFNLPFTCLVGVVETDKYFNYVNFPVLWTECDADIHINGGSPLITCIPFKRSNYNKSVVAKFLNENDLYQNWIVHKKLTSTTSSFYKKKIRGNDNV